MKNANRYWVEGRNSDGVWRVMPACQWSFRTRKDAIKRGVPLLLNQFPVAHVRVRAVSTDAKQPNWQVCTRFVGVPCRKMQPTLQHRMAIWENMLGTVYAMNDVGEIRYFDYDHTAARAFAGVLEAERDPRLARTKDGSYGDYQRPRRGQYVLWILKTNTNTSTEENNR